MTSDEALGALDRWMRADPTRRYTITIDRTGGFEISLKLMGVVVYISSVSLQDAHVRAAQYVDEEAGKLD